MTDEPHAPPPREQPDLHVLWTLPPGTVVTLHDAAWRPTTGPIVRIEPETIVLRVAGRERRVDRQAIAGFTVHEPAGEIRARRSLAPSGDDDHAEAAARADAEQAAREWIEPHAAGLAVLGAVICLGVAVFGGSWWLDALMHSRPHATGRLLTLTTVAAVVIFVAWWFSPPKPRVVIGRLARGFLLAAGALAIVLGACLLS